MIRLVTLLFERRQFILGADRSLPLKDSTIDGLPACEIYWALKHTTLHSCTSVIM